MSDDSTTQCLLFPGIFRKPVVAQFDQREGSSDGGALLLKAADRHYGLVAGLSSCLRDERQAGIENGRVVLAADSLFQEDSGAKHLHCKIHQSGTDTYFYAVSGIGQDPEAKFDPAKLIANRRRDIHGAESLNAVGASFVPYLQKSLDLIKKQVPKLYADEVKQRWMESLFVIDAFTNFPEGYYIDFNVDEQGRVVLGSAKTCFPDPKLGQCTRFSSDKALVGYLRPASPKDSTVQNVHRVMDTAVAVRRNEVAPPFSILTIEPTGARWLDREYCEEIKKPTPAKIPKTKP